MYTLSFNKQAQIALESYRVAWGYLWRKEYRNILLFGFLFNILFLFATFICLIKCNEILIYKIESVLDFDIFTNLKILQFIVKIAVFILVFLILLRIYKTILFILISPLLAYTAEKTEANISEQSFTFSFSIFIKNIFRGIYISLRNMLLQFFMLFMILIFSLLPFVGLLTPWLATFINAYYVGFGLIDYRNELYGYNYTMSKNFISENKYFSAILGLIFNFLFWVPIFGTWVLPIWAVIAATIGSKEIIKQQKKQMILKVV